MQFLSRKQIVAALFAVVVLTAGIFAFFSLRGEAPTKPVQVKFEREIIGTSVEGRDIEAYTYLSAEASAQAGGDGKTHLMFVGGVHGGYEWNSVLLSQQFIDYLEDNPSIIPDNLTVTIIPSANPDGVYKVIGKEGRFSFSDVPAETEEGLGRFNARGVDLNRNFDCKWKPESMWRGNVVSAGTEPFSEPETLAIRDFVLEYDPSAVVFWHSQSDAVYASECENGILPETLAIMGVYSRASGYQAVESFDSYEITGDAEGWLASINIPAITVELSTHEAIEFERNLAGIRALFEYYGN